MTATMRTAVTLIGLLALTMVAALWGWNTLTKPVEGKTVSGICVDSTVSPGDVLTPDLVAVRVLNASDQSGLASRTMESLEGRGFVSGGTGNMTATQPFKGVRIWASDKSNPAVQLVKQQFRNAKVVAGEEIKEPGVIVVLGNDAGPLAQQAPAEVVIRKAATVCSPPITD